MNTFSAPTSLLSRLSGFVLKVLLGAAAAVFAASLLVAGAVAAGVLLVASWVTGRKPAALVFPRGTRFGTPPDVSRRFESGRFGSGTAWRGMRPAPVKADDVVDVPSRDIR